MSDSTRCVGHVPPTGSCVELIDPVEIELALDTLTGLAARLKSKLLANFVRQAYDSIAGLTPVERAAPSRPHKAA